MLKIFYITFIFFKVFYFKMSFAILFIMFCRDRGRCLQNCNKLSSYVKYTMGNILMGDDISTHNFCKRPDFQK